MAAVHDAHAPDNAPGSRETLTILVMEDDAGSRLDHAVAARATAVSRSEVQRWIAAGRVLLDGVRARASQRLAAGQTIVVYIPPAEPAALQPEPLPLDVIYEDAWLVVINKPAGMVVHPAAGHRTGTLVNALLARYPELGDISLAAPVEGDDDEADQLSRPGIVHRLDKDTSGLILVARDAGAQAALQAQFKERLVEKTYLALVEGVPAAGEGLVDAPLGRDPRRRKRMAVVPFGRSAQTDYCVLEALGPAALIEALPRTGRTHQIRVHMAYIRHPIVGDRVYGRRKSAIACPRQFLHAWRLGFNHPQTGERLSFTTTLPADLAGVLESLRQS